MLNVIHYISFSNNQAFQTTLISKQYAIINVSTCKTTFSRISLDTSASFILNKVYITKKDYTLGFQNEGKFIS